MEENISSNDIELREKLGTGSYGSVYKADYLGTDVAVKEFFTIEQFDFKKYVDREIQILKEVRHPNIVQYMGVYQKEGKFYLVTEYVSGGNLKAAIESSLPMNWNFATDIVRALAYLHNHNIIHRDLKGENILITENKRCKLCDFGFSRLIASTDEERRRLSYCGTDAYMAPEIVLCMEFDQRVDIFSFGVVLMELMCGNSAEKSQFKREVPGFGILESEFDVHCSSPGIPPAFLNLAKQCTKSEVELRPTIKEILKTLREIEASLTDLVPLGSMVGGSSVSLMDSPSFADLASPNAMGSPNPLKSPNNLSPGTETISQNGRLTEVSEVPVTTLDQEHSPASSKRMGHRIPHRFSYASNAFGGVSNAKCRYCHKRLGQTYLKCDDCNYCCHKHCSVHVLSACGLSTDLYEMSMNMKSKVEPS